MQKYDRKFIPGSKLVTFFGIVVEFLVATQTGDGASFYTCEQHDKVNNNSNGERKRKSQVKEVTEGT